MLVVMNDIYEPFCPLSKGGIMLSIQNDKEKINYLIEKLIKNAENLYLKIYYIYGVVAQW